jgi:YidC/Oxa1 family membrane protein insertase
MSDSNRRLFITILLCLAVTWVWSKFVEPAVNPAPPPGSEIVDAGSPSAAAPALNPTVLPANTTATAAGASPASDRGVAATPAMPRPPTKRVVLSSSKLRVELTSDGAAITSAQLLGPKYLHAAVHGEPKKQVELIQPNVSPLPLSLEIDAAAPGAALPGQTAVLVPSQAGYEIVTQDERSVTFKTRTATGLEVTKRISLSQDAYKLDLEVSVQSPQALSGRMSLVSTGWSDPAAGGGGFISSYFSSRVQPPQALCKSGKELEQVAVAKPKSFEGTGDIAFTGINEQFFLLATVPLQAPGSACHLDATASGALTAQLDMPLNIAAGGSQKLLVAAFAGPKLRDVLDEVSPALRESIDFGFWGVIVKVLLVGMTFLHDNVPPHNWGLAIILLTLTIKLITFPLTHKQMKSMEEMKRVQPQIDEMKKKYAGDTARQNQEQMKLFAEHGVNPMASCLPMLVQFPVWIALYNTLRVSAELFNSAFIPGWLDDLTAKDPYFIVPAVMGVTMVITQVLTPTPTSNPQQKTMTYAMSAFFTLAMFNLPSGLTLYILTNNILSISQQIYLRRTFAKRSPPASSQTIAAIARR